MQHIKPGQNAEQREDVKDTFDDLNQNFNLWCRQDVYSCLSKHGKQSHILNRNPLAQIWLPKVKNSPSIYAKFECEYYRSTSKRCI